MAINGSVIDSTRYQRPWSYRADLHECSSSKVCSGWSSDSVIDVTVCTKSCYRSNLVSQEFSERERARLKYSTWQRLLSRCGFNLGLAVCACAAASHTYVLNKLAGNNTLIIMTSLISTALLLVKWSWFCECCLLSLKVAYARDWLQFAKSILSAESARSPVDYGYDRETNFSTDTVRVPARAPFLNYAHRALQDQGRRYLILTVYQCCD